MGKKVFVSYSHQQGAWVLDRLVPCLRAGGAEVYVDVERFKPGHGVRMGNDYTLYAVRDGVVRFQTNRCVHVDPVA